MPIPGHCGTVMELGLHRCRQVMTECSSLLLTRVSEWGFHMPPSFQNFIPLEARVKWCVLGPKGNDTASRGFQSILISTTHLIFTQPEKQAEKRGLSWERTYQKATRSLQQSQA